MTSEDVKDAIIKHLYHNQGISGIFDIQFKLKKRVVTSRHPQDYNYVEEFNGAEITVDLNEK